MSYGRADKIAGGAADAPAAGNTPPIDPALYRRADVRRILAVRDIAGLYRVLRDEGVTQRQIAALTGQSQSEVSEILTGRRVLAYDVLVRIADGLGIPRALMGLSCGEHSTYGGEGTVADPPKGVDAEMLRRDLITLGAGVAVGAPVAKLGELLERLELPDPMPAPLPSQLSHAHVEKVRDLTRRLGEAGNTSVSAPEALSAAAAWASRLLDVPGAEAVVVAESGRAAVQAVALADSATALSRLGYPEAEQFAVTSVRCWEGGSRISRTLSGVVLATIHVRAGEPDGLRMAHHAVTATSKLTSVRARTRLVPLVAALEARSGADARQLARMARQVAATRAWPWRPATCPVLSADTFGEEILKTGTNSHRLVHARERRGTT